MAVVLEALASYVQNMLTEMVAEDVRMFLGVPDEMNKMEVKLRDLKKFIADADRRNITDKSVQEWVKELRGAMYNATDILDLCQLKAMKRGPSRDMGCFNPLLFCMRNPFHAYDIGSRLMKLNEKLVDIEKRSKTFNFINLTSYEDRGGSMESSYIASHESTGELDKLGVVGEQIKEDTRTLVEFLVRKEKTIHEHNKVMVFSIVGVGGIGKTTLAKNIFNHEIIQQEFQKKIWLSVNQNFNDLDLLGRAITEAGGDHQAARNTKAALVRTLKEALEGYKTLIVLDDVWDHQAWERVLEAPLIQALARGSRVLVTTRHDMVARGMMAEEPYHHVNKLDPEDSWSLLKKQVIRNPIDEYDVDRLKDIGMKIIEKCDGLPLALKVMGGLLRQKMKRPSDWEDVINDSIWSFSQMPKELNSAIYLSYQDMDPSLKPCFLHFSLLPTKSALFNVDVDDVVGMWIAEGFIHGGSRDLEELGREYYKELILRNLIEPDKKSIDQRVCNMHDVVRSFAQFVARDEALAAQSSQIDLIDKLKSQKFTQLSLETKGSESNGLEWMSLQTQISLRTLISIGPIKIKPGDSLVTFSSLRTLHVQDVNFDSLAKYLVHLKYLRYLSIVNNNMPMLPENIGKMKLLQYICVSGCDNLDKLPGSIGQLRHLRFLNLANTSIKNVPRGFSGLTNLRKLFGFPTYMDGNWCSLEELGPLDKLIDLGINSLGNISSPLFAKKAGLFEKVRLRLLSLSFYSRYEDGELLLKEDENIANKGLPEIEEVFEQLCPPPCLETLQIHGYFGSRLPSWMMMSTAVVPLGRLKFLDIEDMPCCTELPNSLCQLPSLDVIHIKGAPAIKRVGPEFLQPRHHEHPGALDDIGSAVRLQVWDCAGLEWIGYLPKIQHLIIIDCPMLKVLEGMPALKKLSMEDYKMTTLPRYLRDVNPMDLLEIYCDISVLTSMAEGKSSPVWDMFSHINQVKAYADDDDNGIDRKWYVLYTRYPFSFKTNISRSAISLCKKARIERVWLAYDTTCPIEEEWAVGGADTHKRQPLCQRFRCNAHCHLVCWLRGACLHCCEAGQIATSTGQWTEAAEYWACTVVWLTAQQFAGTQGV